MPVNAKTCSALISALALYELPISSGKSVFSGSEINSKLVYFARSENSFCFALFWVAKTSFIPILKLYISQSRLKDWERLINTKIGRL